MCFLLFNQLLAEAVKSMRPAAVLPLGLDLTL